MIGAYLVDELAGADVVRLADRSKPESRRSR
jgi:hypothetical protein